MNCSVSIHEESRRRIKTQNLVLSLIRERETWEERYAWKDSLTLKREGRIRRTKETTRIRSLTRRNWEEIQREDQRTTRKDQTVRIPVEELKRCPWRLETRWHPWC